MKGWFQRSGIAQSGLQKLGKINAGLYAKSALN